VPHPRSITRLPALIFESDDRGHEWLALRLRHPVASKSVGEHQLRVWHDFFPRHVNMTISLAFLAPSLVEGRLPRGVGLARLIDAPAEWHHQHRLLGLAS
jgi:site-specific DNA recombinase